VHLLLKLVLVLGVAYQCLLQRTGFIVDIVTIAVFEVICMDAVHLPLLACELKLLVDRHFPERH